MNLRPLIQELPRRGHRVIAALRDFSSVHKVLGSEKVEYLQAPFQHQKMGLKIFAYLKPFPALPQLLGLLHGLPNPMLIYASGVDDALKNQFRSPNLRFADAPVNLVKAAAECDVAILNGTHGSAAAMLLAGKPTLHIPIFLEQGVTAQAVARLGAGINVMPNEPAKISAGLQALLHLEQFGSAARAFAARHADFDPARQIEKLVDRAEQLAAG